MKIGITKLIAENIVPPNASSLAIFDGDTKICDIDISKMQPTDLSEKLYSFGLVSDIHLWKEEPTWNANEKFDDALGFFESGDVNCAFCVVCGDLTQTGFYLRTDESDASTTYLDETQFEKYKEICDNHPKLPVYELMGNHESYYVDIANDLNKMKTYTGNDALYYTIEYQNDVFIFCGQPTGTTPMSDEAFDFLSNTLSANSDKRCFVFVHPIWNDDSGDANGIYSNHSVGLGGTQLSWWSKGEDLKNLLKQYPKVVLFHGHTHIKFEEQAKDKSLNYTNKNGFHSVHIPSLGRPREIINNELVYAPTESQGYIVDVYDDCIVLRGRDFVNEKFLPNAQYCIDTTLQTIAPNTFTDDTGTITT